MTTIVGKLSGDTIVLAADRLLVSGPQMSNITKIYSSIDGEYAFGFAGLFSTPIKCLIGKLIYSKINVKDIVLGNRFKTLDDITLQQAEEKDLPRSAINGGQFLFATRYDGIPRLTLCHSGQDNIYCADSSSLAIGSGGSYALQYIGEESSNSTHSSDITLLSASVKRARTKDFFSSGPIDVTVFDPNGIRNIFHDAADVSPRDLYINMLLATTKIKKGS